LPGLEWKARSKDRAFFAPREYGQFVQVDLIARLSKILHHMQVP
jgi:hypothetical protein